MAYLSPQLPSPLTAPAWFGASTDQPLDLAARIHAQLQDKKHRERWKYTRVQPILDLLNQPVADSDELDLPAEIIQSSLRRDQAPAEIPVFFADGLMSTLDAAPEAMAHLCYNSSIRVLDVKGESSQPLRLEAGHLTQPLIIRLGEGAKLELHESYPSGDAAQLQTLWIDMQRGSQLIHARNNFSDSTHWQFLRVRIGQDATYRLHTHAQGATLRRQDMQVICAGQGAHAEVTSAAFVSNKLHLDQQITIEHQAPHTTSQQRFHNIADGGAKITFNGRIHIHRQCPGVDANLSNKNLSIGKGATINTKPELEIYTDDVKCSHGSTIGSIDPDHLFYFASRGIPAQQAQSLLMKAFLGTCITGPLAAAASEQMQFHTAG